MGLTDPELELLLEVVADDPGDEAYVRIGEELLRRSRWSEAITLLARGIAHAPEERAWEMLGRAHLESGDPAAALSAVGSVSRTPGSEAARVELLALERCGQGAHARTKAEKILEVDPGDVVAQAVLERLDRPAPAGPVRSPDPALTVEQAERYVALGRVDRSLRLYRRLVFHNPDHGPLLGRLRELAQEHPVAEEISRDFTSDTAPVPASLAPLIVVPQVGPTSLGLSQGAPPPPVPPADSEEEDTDTFLPVPTDQVRKKRRRSLLNP